MVNGAVADQVGLDLVDALNLINNCRPNLRGERVGRGRARSCQRGVDLGGELEGGNQGEGVVNNL